MSASTSSLRNTSPPKVVIVGRPNVGKSTLFNRLVGMRKTITDPTPGVTRDTIEAHCRLNDRDILLVDTGGFQTDQDGISELVSRRSLDSLEGADVIVLLLEVTGVTPEDEDFIKVLRPYSDRIILAANKADNDNREAEIWDFHALGFSRVVAISAEHRRNIEELERLIGELLPDHVTSDSETESPVGIKLAILGKPNTGKSTLLNRLLGFERALVSDIPGTTRDVIEGGFSFNGIEFSVLDTAGIRRKKAVHEAIEYYSVSRAISSIAHSDIVFLVVDVRDGITEQDKKIAGHIVKHGRGAIIALNKWDIIESIPNTLNAVTDRTRFLFPLLDFAPIVPISAEKGSGIEELINAAVKIKDQLEIRIPTPQLNKALQHWIELHPPPYGKKRFRVKYITQVRSNPLKFSLFVNKTRGFPGSWVSYVENNLRKEFGLSSVPISIELKGRA